MPNQIEVKLAEITEKCLSIQNRDATLSDYVIKLDEGKLERFKQIQRDFMRMQSELQELIKDKKG